MAVHLLLGYLDDPFCLGVRKALQARNLVTHTIANPFANPSRFSWQLDSERSASRLTSDDEQLIHDDQIAGVFVRNMGWIDPEGWTPADLAYVHSEAQAALLAWLWSLPCPVVNRFSPAMWYRPQAPLLSWQPLLRRCALPALEMLVTNVDREARDFGQRLALEGAAGAVYGPLSSDARYLLTEERDWNGLAALEDCAPVCLTYPHGTVQFVCVVGDGVVWEGEPSREAAFLESSLRNFAKVAGLGVVELAIASTARGLRVITVDCDPDLRHFGDAARRTIADGVADLLTAERNDSHWNVGRTLQGSLCVILVCGGLADSVTELVCARLTACGYPYRLLDLAAYPGRFRVKWDWNGSSPVGYIAGPDWQLGLDEPTGVYIRFLGSEGRLPLPNVTPDAAPAMYFESDTCLMALLNDLPCTVVNRHGGGMSNNSKAYQALLIRRCGLKIPPTLVTNDPSMASEFYQAYQRDVIYKSLSGTRSIVRRLQPEQLSRLPLLRQGPTQFQAFIPGENVRVHTVGSQLFATRIRSEAVDYRYAHLEGHGVEMEPTTLPALVGEACLRLAHELDLLVTGIDLKETPEGDYYCFEVNPCPGFLYYERYSGQPISTALANLLHCGNSA